MTPSFPQRQTSQHFLDPVESGVVCLEEVPLPALQSGLYNGSYLGKHTVRAALRTEVGSEEKAARG